MAEPFIVYSPKYDIYVPLLSDLHPFDGRKYGRAYARVEAEHADLAEWTLAPSAAITEEQLQSVHSEPYLKQTADSAQIATILELPALVSLPLSMLKTFGIDLVRHISDPMRWACAGTLLAARRALQIGQAVNLSGGYHHAKPSSGEGFCVFADVAVALTLLRNEGVLSATDRVLHVDLDAHMGNGLAHCFLHDRRVVLFDAFNADIYPRDATARARLDYPHPLSESTSTQEYLDLLRQQLPKVVHDVQPRLAIFNAGTDILQGDDLGGLNISREAVVQRDRLVIETLERANIPWFLVTSGGYSQESHQLIAETLRWLVARRKGRI